MHTNSKLWILALDATTPVTKRMTAAPVVFAMAVINAMDPVRSYRENTRPAWFIATRI
jgi:hypothetical protein